MKTFEEHIKNEKKISRYRHIEVDTDILYGPLDKAARYLLEIHKKYPKAELTENWTGYEDMEMVFGYLEEETDQEFNDRMRYSYESYKRTEKARVEYESQRRDRETYEKLKRKHGW